MDHVDSVACNSIFSFQKLMQCLLQTDFRARVMRCTSPACSKDQLRQRSFPVPHQALKLSSSQALKLSSSQALKLSRVSRLLGRLEHHELRVECFSDSLPEACELLESYVSQPMSSSA
jgi:hypothetical protein